MVKAGSVKDSIYKAFSLILQYHPSSNISTIAVKLFDVSLRTKVSGSLREKSFKKYQPTMAQINGPSSSKPSRIPLHSE